MPGHDGERLGRTRLLGLGLVAAGIVSVHPRTLRIYEEEGLLCPARTPTNIRLYSETDLRRVLWIRHLTQNLGVNLAGVRILFELEERLAEGPVITVPAITLEGDGNGAPHPEPDAYAAKFAGPYSHRTIEGGIGHNLPQEAPDAFATAVREVGGLCDDQQR